MDDVDVQLRLLTEEGVAKLLETAVADADPLEVMVPVAGPPGWNAERRRAFLEFHRTRSIGTDHPVEATYVIVVDARVVGAARLEPTADAVEAGVWIGRSHRGRGIGKVVLTHLRDVAAKGGVLQLTASTTAENTAARCLLDRGGARITADGTDVTAILEL